MKHFKKAVAAASAVALMGFAASSHAGLLTLNDARNDLFFGSIPSAGTNEALPAVFGIPSSGDGFGWYGAMVTGTAGATYKYDVFGAEAGFRNRFSVDETIVYTHATGNNLSPTIKATYTGSTLDFRFVTNTSNVGSPGTTVVTNDMSLTGNTNDVTLPLRPNFFASFDLFADSEQTNPLTGDVLWLFLDDSDTVDDNHDDLLVRITATARAVPEPGTLALLGLGLMGVAAIRRKRSA